MLLTTLCYIEHRDHYLMLHRTKKAHDLNEGKWIGVGGKFLEGESPEECLLREVFEETGYRLASWRFRGIVTFRQLGGEAEYMHLFTADDFVLDDDAASSISRAFQNTFPDDPAAWPVPPCEEGELAWVHKDKIKDLPLWEGDAIFLQLLREDGPFFSLKLTYDGDTLIESVLDGHPHSAGAPA